MLKFFNFNTNTNTNSNTNNKGISTPILLSVIALSAVVLVGLIVFLQYPQTQTDRETELKSIDQTEQAEATKQFQEEYRG